MAEWLMAVTAALLVLLTYPVSAQSGDTVTIRMLDSKTGLPIVAREFMVWLSESSSAQRSGHEPIWVHADSQGRGELQLPSGAHFIRVYATYGKANWGYVDCDAVKDRTQAQQWYSVTDILRTGVTAPNYCSAKKAEAKAGEFVFFVREMTFWEKMKT